MKQTLTTHELGKKLLAGKDMPINYILLPTGQILDFVEVEESVIDKNLETIIKLEQFKFEREPNPLTPIEWAALDQTFQVE